MINPQHRVTIEYCVPCHYLPRATELAGEILGQWAPVISGLELRSGTGGRLEISVDDELVFSKAQLKRFPDTGEVSRLMGERLGAPIEF
ncbi:MAG TPA: Rdx family protein [Candidatus Dormibacteraeota bacterium]|nr:Rdx family protein [Candidatus Dormibacteraeota bacterium]